MQSTDKKTKIIPLDTLVKKAAFSELASIASVVSRIMQIMKNPNASASDLKNLIEVDPPLCAKILRRANSSFYGLPTKVSGIQNAIVMIGFNSIREMALSLKVGKLFEGNVNIENRYSRKKLWKHSLAVALCSKSIFRREFREAGENAYSAGLMHDIGIIAEEQFMPELFMELFKDSPETQNFTLSDLEKSAFRYTHSDTGRELMKIWNMPEELIQTLSFHHNPLLNTNIQTSRITMTIFIAECLCNMNNLGIEKISESQLDTYNKILGIMNIKHEAVEIIFEDVMGELTKMEEEGELYP